MPTTTRPTRAAHCSCTGSLKPANATVDAPYFPGIRRHETWSLDELDPSCIAHAHLATSTLAADLRYGD